MDMENPGRAGESDLGVVGVRKRSAKVASSSSLKPLSKPGRFFVICFPSLNTCLILSGSALPSSIPNQWNRLDGQAVVDVSYCEARLREEKFLRRDFVFNCIRPRQILGKIGE